MVEKSESKPVDTVFQITPDQTITLGINPQEDKWQQALTQINSYLGETINPADRFSFLAQCHNGIGLHLTDVNRPQEAIAEHREAIKSADKALALYDNPNPNRAAAGIRKTIAFIKLGQLTAKTKPSRAERYFKKAKRMIVKYSNGDGITDIRRKLGIIGSQQKLALGLLQP